MEKIRIKNKLKIFSFEWFLFSKSDRQQISPFANVWISHQRDKNSSHWYLDKRGFTDFLNIYFYFLFVTLQGVGDQYSPWLPIALKNVCLFIISTNPCSATYLHQLFNKITHSLPLPLLPIVYIINTLKMKNKTGCLFQA